MTEREAIQWLKHTRAYQHKCDNCEYIDIKGACNEECKDFYDMAIKALEEIQQYKSIGTVEEFKRAKAMENVYEQVKWERDVALSQLEEIGVSLGQKMEEFKALKEKSVPKKPFKDKNNCHFLTCPTCKNEIYWDTDYGQQHFEYCTECGQKLDWSEPYNRLECE